MCVFQMMQVHFVQLYIYNVFNIGKIEMEEQIGEVTGGIASINWSDVMTYNNCYYLVKIYETGVGYGTSTGVTEWDRFDKFPSVKCSKLSRKILII